VAADKPVAVIAAKIRARGSALLMRFIAILAFCCLGRVSVSGRG
jgi:hypothetical protein